MTAKMRAKVCSALGILTLIAGSTLMAGDMPTAGSKAPDFTLSSQEGKSVSLHDFKGQWVVLYFYPKDMTTGCTIEAHNFQRDLAQYEQSKAAIVGVSVDSVDSHQQFCTKETLTFKLLSDPNHKVVDLYGSAGEYSPEIVAKYGASMAARNTFLIDPDGVIRKVYVKVKPETHSPEVLAALAELRKSAR
jgi:peroxiredoxin Q/BCP